MIEILTGVFYDPTKEWYEQPQELIELALAIEQTTPIDYELEVGVQNPTHQRLKYAVWESTTEMGTFRMRVDKVYVYDIEHKERQFLKVQNKVTIIKITE